MSTSADSINCIKCKESSSCFKKLIPSELEFISQYKTQIAYRKGETLCKQGAFADSIQYISEGLVKLYLETNGNKDINLKIMKASEFIGLSSLYGDNEYVYSAVALSNAKVCLINKSSFRDVLMKNGACATELVKWYCKCETHVFGIVRSIGYKQMNGRLADTLLYLCGEEFEGFDIFSLITRKDIADFACISTESTVRLLKDFSSEGIIKLDGKRIDIVDKETLLKISRMG